jgi:hypothetical protein
MELALPPIHPKVPELLEHLGLQIVEPVKWNVLLCRKTGQPDNRALILKFGSDRRKAASIEYEVTILRDVLPQLDQQFFERLVLPEYVNDGRFGDIHWVLTKYLEGKPLLYEWSELSTKPEVLGGRGLGPEVAVLAADVLRDLRLVDIDAMPDFVRRFSFDRWLEEFQVRSRELVDARIWEQRTVERALELFKDVATERYQGNMFTNGDFYPRNFILLPKGKIAVADWVGGIDPWEFVAMKAYVMMWGNPAWQKAYIAEINRHFPVDIEEMQVGLLVKCSNRIWLWREQPEELLGMARAQLINCFHSCLDIDSVRKIFNP